MGAKLNISMFGIIVEHIDEFVKQFLLVVPGVRLHPKAYFPLFLIEGSGTNADDFTELGINPGTVINFSGSLPWFPEIG
jgi:hypothetical protein